MRTSPPTCEAFVPSGRLKFAQDALRVITDAARTNAPGYVADPAGFFESVTDEVRNHPSVIPWGLGGAGLGFLAGVPVTRLLWRGGRAFMDTSTARTIDDAVRAFSRTAPARFFSKNEFGLPQLRPISKRTVPFAGAVLGARGGWDAGRRLSEEDKYGPTPTDRPYVYIPMR